MSVRISNDHVNKATIIFVDYESWLFGMRNQYGVYPDVEGWFAQMQMRGSIRDIFFFGDFNNSEMENEVSKLRLITNNIIYCSPSGYKKNYTNKKNYTDFIMLDHIYQNCFKYEDVEQYIIFSGDKHFRSVIAFMKNFKNKVVGVCAVQGTLSEDLRNGASWYEEVMPAQRHNSVDPAKCRQIIYDNFLWVESQPNLNPTFRKTVQVITNKYGVESDVIEKTLSEMISDGTLNQYETTLQDGTVIKCIRINRTRDPASASEMPHMQAPETQAAQEFMRL